MSTYKTIQLGLKMKMRHKCSMMHMTHLGPSLKIPSMITEALEDTD